MLVWFIVKCKGVKILLGISWPSGLFHINLPGFSTDVSFSQQRLMDPPGSAYRSETGGLMEALRRLTPEQSISFCILEFVPSNCIHTVRQYHSTYYVPHNLSLIVAGKLSSGTASLLNVVQKFVEPSIIAHGQDKGPTPPGWNRPFLETPSANRVPVSKPVKETVEFPEKDESEGYHTEYQFHIDMPRCW